ncbi:MAG: QueT transporter family protein [Oscillospiraceae bacterium]|nr:QueT transporter family protein [Oscillospiraceae bacterium]
MKNRVRTIAHAAIIAALYAVLTHLQNLLLPGSATWAIQVRLSEMLCVLAFFTPAAIPGLTLGCLLFNLTFSAALPLDFLMGSLATFLAAQTMWRLRRVKCFGIPLPGLLMPALTNAVLVGWELTVYIGGGFPLNAFYVALGELIALLGPGTILYLAIRRRQLDRLLFYRAE